MRFTFYCEETPVDGLSNNAMQALQREFGNYVQTDIPLAVELVYADGAEICRLNAETRGISQVTDVLSYPSLEEIRGKYIRGAEHPFEVDEQGNLLLGSIVVCCDRAKEQAEEYGHSYERELHYLIVHGVMHCLGYDHITDEERAEMRAQEERVLTALGITRG